ncbi:MAG TPA: hypothetical protein VGF44_16585 [Terriglobales bacterium]
MARLRHDDQVSKRSKNACFSRPWAHFDSTVHELAVGAIRNYCEGDGIAVAEIRVHMVPPELSTGDQILAWFQSIPSISITVLPYEEVGFGGPLPPTGEAG